jgi:hypothetical protein
MSPERDVENQVKTKQDNFLRSARIYSVASFDPPCNTPRPKGNANVTNRITHSADAQRRARPLGRLGNGARLAGGSTLPAENFIG